ncbi:hypothetical protein F4810DRAFT_650280 [Camillea tinctor]|nr:hypothetical protein F4810DRAFT_650280 [Camillea tinctor]
MRFLPRSTQAVMKTIWQRRVSVENNAVPGAPFGIIVKKDSSFRQSSHHIGFSIEIGDKLVDLFQEGPQHRATGWSCKNVSTVSIHKSGLKDAHDSDSPADNDLLPGETNTFMPPDDSFESIRVNFYRLLAWNKDFVPDESLITPERVTKIPRKDDIILESSSIAMLEHMNFEDDMGRPFATFEFRYAFRDTLARAGIAFEDEQREVDLMVEEFGEEVIAELYGDC